MYWKDFSYIMPSMAAYLNDSIMYPPLHPWLKNGFPAQSTSCCSERVYKMPLAILLPDSMAPTAEKAQSDPHFPWYLTDVTALFFRQSTVTGICNSLAGGW